MASVLVSSCESSQSQSGAGGAGDSGVTTGTTGPTGSFSAPKVGSTTVATSFTTANAIKVIFNKSSFFHNQFPNALGCAGDAKIYYNPMTDRAVPLQPLWLKNIAVDITNSNAFRGPSRAAGCAVSGIGAPDASNCASFDDLQPLSGAASRNILLGGFGCQLGIAGCSPTTLTSDIWNLTTNDVSTSGVWNQQSTGLPFVPPTVAAVSPPQPGLAWHGGGYDELHDQFYLFGGVTNSTVGPAPGTVVPNVFSNNVVQITLEPDRSVSTTPAPTVLIPPQGGVYTRQYSGRRFYAGWALSQNVSASPFDSALSGFFPPPPMAGPSFTFGLRREPSMKSLCKTGDSPASLGPCNSTIFTTSSVNQIASSEHGDFYLLAGGMQTNGQFNKNIYIYKPHGFSNDVGKGTLAPNTDGDWMLMSNVTAPGLSSKVMRVVDVSSGFNTTASPFVPYVATEVGSNRPNAAFTDTFNGWLGRAYHQTSYDPAMNRFYIFGGLENHLGLPATSAAPDVATGDVWVYDPPALGRRPTSLCFSNEMPDKTHLADPTNPLPAGAAAASFLRVMATSGGDFGTINNLDASANYLRSPFVFPPGGCLQRFKNDGAMPAGRFSHGQVFDRDNKIMYVFGGCSAPTAIRGSGLTNAGDPVMNCAGGGLLNDLWMYVPPSTTEIVSKDFRSTTPGPYNALTLLGNIFGTDTWLDHLPLFTGGNEPSNAALTTPEPWRVLGEWIKISPTGSPTMPPPRAGAQVSFDRAHRRLYVQGGFGCSDPSCATSPPKALNDLWVYLPPEYNRDCPDFRSAGRCNASQGQWIKLRDDLAASNLDEPTQRYGGIMAHTEPQFAYGDDFYTVTDTACQFQGPIASADANVNKQLVGAIYIDVDRNQMGANENLLINLRFLPFDNKTRLPAWNSNGTLSQAADDFDNAATTDTAAIRVQVMNNPMKFAESIQSSPQPRFHEFISGTTVLADTFTYAAGATGQVTEKQIFVPLSIDPTINMIKIERVTGSVKFFEMTVTKF